MNSMGPYIAGNLYTAVALVSTLSCYISFQVLQFLITFQMSAYLKVLQNRIETYGPTDRSTYEHHKSILLLLRDYNSLFSGCMYEEVMISSLQPCGYGYAFIKALKANEPGVFHLLHNLFMTLVGPFIMCACGEEISSQMEKLHDSSYMSNWYEENPRVRRNLLMMKLMASTPCTLNYRLFVAFNFPCFSTIIQGLYSYLTMIINFE
ncbi:hypothetical protein O3M35_008409 [Rhynocoris fuscipes]|uniref:Uncharacterized protein n=1 Tax=Rhynocoris fuscipes TaxID=488301 RepID=A0AAW1D668_9HEMI